jgi:succinoglycan biosynthesis transport protein ExoP
LLKSHFPKLLVCAAAFGLVALVISLLVPKKYEGFVQILIDQKALQASVPLTPAERSISDLVEFGRSRSIVTQVQQLTAYQVLQAAGDAVVKSLGIPQGEAEEFAAVNMRENVTVDAEIGSDMMTLRVRMSNPEWAQAYAGAVYDEFERLNRSTTIDLASRAIASLESQMKEVKLQLKKIDDETTALREKYNAANLENQISSEILSIGRIREARDAAVIDLSTGRDRLVVLEQELSKTPKYIAASQSEVLNQNVLGLEAAISAARADREQLLQRYFEDHELVRAQDRRIAKLQEEYQTMTRRLDATSTSSLNPNWSSLLGEVSQARAGIHGFEARVQKANQELTRAEEKLREYPSVQQRMIELQRHMVGLERTFVTYSDQLEALRLAQQGRTSPTRLVTPASALPDPVSPRTLINTLIGIIVGLVVGFVWMVRSESKHLPIRSINQQNALSLEPVYRIIPEMRLPFRGLAKSPPEAFETLLVNCLRSEKRPYRVAVVGVLRESGASTTALNYAISAQRRGLRCLVVSSDPRSSIRRVVGTSIPEPPGRVRVQDTFEFMNFVDQNMVTGEAGKTRLEETITSAETDVTVFDVEPTLRSADYVILGQHVDEVILLVRADRAKTVEFLTAQQALTDAGCPRVTVVFARTPESAVVTDQTSYAEEMRALPS